MRKIDPKLLVRMLEGAHNYAKAEKSDPWALARALLHTRGGLCGIDRDGADSFYKADEHREERKLPSGESFFVPVYRNVQRV